MTMTASDRPVPAGDAGSADGLPAFRSCARPTSTSVEKLDGNEARTTYVGTGSPDDAGPAGRICYEAFDTIAERHTFPPDFRSPASAPG